MMIIRNGILSTLRARGRTALFSLLILLLCLSLSLGGGLWAYSAAMLSEMDEAYTSVALLEYMGADYPDEDAADPYSRSAAEKLDSAAISALEGVELWEETLRCLGRIEGFQRLGDVPYADMGVIEFTQFAPRHEYGYNPESQEYDIVNTNYAAISNEVFFAMELEGSKMVTIDTGDFVPESGRRYTLHGRFVEAGMGSLYFVVEPIPGSDAAPWQDTTDSEPDEAFMEAAEYYRRASAYVNIEASADVGSLEAFQQQMFTLRQGRFPAPGEAGVCVVSGDVAVQMGLELGDTIKLERFTSDENDRFAMADMDTRSLEIVGIAGHFADKPGQVWVSDAEGGARQSLYGYTLGRAVLDNSGARRTADAIQALCPENVRVTLYDQGYSAAAQALESMRTSSMAVSLASAAGALAVLILFAYLFVGRQRETVTVLVSLGTPTAKIRAWLLSGAVLISGVSAAVGAGISAACMEKIIAAATAAAEELYSIDRRYSEAAMGVVREAVGALEAPMWPPMAAFGFVFICSVVLCCIFLGQSRRSSTPRRGRLKVRVPREGSSTAGRGALRFALLSARRGGWRSAAVPAAALALSLLLGILAMGVEGWSSQTEALYANTEIRANFVSSNGRSSRGLTIDAETLRELYKSGLVEDMGYSMTWNYWTPEDMPAFGTGAFAEESRKSWIASQPYIVAANYLSAAPEFVHSSLPPKVTYLDGWDESFLQQTEQVSVLKSTRFPVYSGRYGFSYLEAEEEAAVIPCLVSRRYLAEKGLNIGDVFSVRTVIQIPTHEMEVAPILRIVGAFEPAGADDNIYVPAAYWMDPRWIMGEEDLLGANERVDIKFTDYESRDKYFYFFSRLSTCSFTLTDARELETLRDFLADAGFSQVGDLGKIRSAVLLHDQNFVETLGGLGRYIAFSRILFPVLFALVAVLGFVISWLMVNSRRMEFAILRGLGASRSRVFFSFFTEQFLLCLAGCIVSAVILLAAGGSFSVLLAIAVFLACYLAGAALSVFAVGRTKLMSLLSERE